MQIYLFYHLVMKSTINRPNRDDDFCFTGTGLRATGAIPSKACHCCLWIRGNPYMADRQSRGNHHRHW
jgi:hypothetical protein